MDSQFSHTWQVGRVRIRYASTIRRPLRMQRPRQPISDRSAWKASERGKNRFVFALTDRHLESIERAFDIVSRRALDVCAISRHDFSFDGLEEDLEMRRDEVMWGSGLIVLSGVPISRYNKTRLGMIFWGLGTHFGDAVSQSVMGDRLGHVIDVARKDYRERAYRNSTELALHTDACDMVGMICLHKARRGGVSGFASGTTIYNEILAQQPDPLNTLFDGYRYHRFGEQLPGAAPVTGERIPVFSERDGYLSVQ